MYAALARILRIGSLIVCLIVVASFAMFAFDQVDGASQHQQSEIATGSWTPPTPAAPHHGGVRRTIDNADGRLTSVFSGLTAGSHSEWMVHGVQTLLALLVFGFGLGYVARFVRVRA